MIRAVLQFLAGMVAVLCFHFVFFILLALSIDTLLSYFPSLNKGHLPGLNILAIGLTGLGLFQLVYVVPLVLYFKKQTMPRIVQGVLLTAALTLLGTAFCGSTMFF